VATKRDTALSIGAGGAGAREAVTQDDEARAPAAWRAPVRVRVKDTYRAELARPRYVRELRCQSAMPLAASGAAILRARRLARDQPCSPAPARDRRTRQALLRKETAARPSQTTRRGGLSRSHGGDHVARSARTMGEPGSWAGQASSCEESSWFVREPLPQAAAGSEVKWKKVIALGEM
jgi:hypothetical protein